MLEFVSGEVFFLVFLKGIFCGYVGDFGLVFVDVDVVVLGIELVDVDW